MRNILKNLLLTSSFLIALVAVVFAGNPEVTTFNMKKSEGKWTLEISLTQASAMYAMTKYHEDIDIDLLSEDEYKDLMVEYIKKNILMTGNKRNLVMIGTGEVELKREKANFEFKLFGLPKDLQTMRVYLGCFTQGENQEAVLKIHGKSRVTKMYLNAQNKYKAKLVVENGDFKKKL